MKILRYLTAVAVAALSLSACEKEPADLFSTAPVAAVMDSHADILMTENAMTESVTFSWQKARNIAGTVSYKLYAADETAETLLTTTEGLFYSAAKTAFRTQLGDGLDLPENSNVSLSFYVVADNGEISVKSEPIAVKLFIYGDYVAAVPAAVVSDVVLAPESASEQLELLTWQPARLGYNESVTYSVSASVGTGAAVVVAEGLTETSLSKSVDEWNEAVVAAGAPEAAASTVDFVVTAYSDSCTGGIESESVSVGITTYVATYPARMYTPGGHQGWDPATSFAIPQSSVRKGLYEAFVDLTTAGADVTEFKFSPEPAWGSDFGAADVTVDVKDGNTVVTAVVSGGANIAVPSGFYRVRLDKKFNTLEMLKIESVGIIGDATVGGWSEETPLVYDAETNTYSLTTNMLSGKEFKFRANGGWTYSIGFDGTFETNSNYTFGKADGEYKIVLDVNSHPYGVKFLSTSFP
ncbi:MAG: SusE domain-containing protein, partial [Alistipes sp.]|nr:SusE domain-containing protein [Alistipes sp.]